MEIQNIEFKERHEKTFQDVRNGLNVIDGIQLHDAKVVEYEPQSGTPDSFTVQGTFDLYGGVQAEIQSTYSVVDPRIEYKVAFRGQLSLPKLLPLFDDEFGAVKLQDTSLVYRSRAVREDELAGLVVSTTVLFSGHLDFINALLRDVFGQEKPHLKFSGLLSTRSDCLTRVPKPIGFTLRGVIPDMSVCIMDVLKITNLGIDLTWIRRGSHGGYDDAYGFFGSGSIESVDVDWYISKYGDSYSLMIVTQSENWKDIGGIKGVDVDNVTLTTAWIGTKISSVILELECTMALREATVLLQGYYSRDMIEVCGVLYDCSLQTILDLYEDVFGTAITANTDHEISFSTLCVRVYRGEDGSGLYLHGEVTVDGHTSVDATISLSSEGITIGGAIESFAVCDVMIDSLSLDLSIGKHHFSVCFSGQVLVHKYTFAVSVFLDKSSGNALKYTVYGAASGGIELSHLFDGIEGSFLDLSIEQLAVCVSNQDIPTLGPSVTTRGETLKRGFSVYADVKTPEAIASLLKNGGPQEVTFFGHCQSGKTGFEGDIGILIATGHLIEIPPIRSKSVSLGVSMSSKNIGIKANADFDVIVQGSRDPLNLFLGLGVDFQRVQGSMAMKGEWVNPLGLCQDLTIYRLGFELGVNYQVFIATGLPSELGLQGKFKLKDFEGNLSMFLSDDSTDQLLDLELKNLDVAEVVRAVGHLLGEDIRLYHGSKTFYIHVLKLYFSTGMTFLDEEYPAGIKVKADLTLFEKKALVDGEVTSDRIKFFGTINRFTIGDMEVRGAHGNDPRIEMELSQSTKRIDIDAMVHFGWDDPDDGYDSYDDNPENDVNVTIYLHVDLERQELDFDFNLRILGEITVKAIATLNGPMPKVAISQNQEETTAIGGSLKGKTFRIYIKMTQKDVGFLPRLVNFVIDEILGYQDEDASIVRDIIGWLIPFQKPLLQITSIIIQSQEWTVGAKLQGEVTGTIAYHLPCSFRFDFPIHWFARPFVDALKYPLIEASESIKNAVEHLSDGMEHFLDLAWRGFLEFTEEAGKFVLQVVQDLLPKLDGKTLGELTKGGVLGTGISKEDFERLADQFPGYWPFILKALAEVTDPEGKSIDEIAKDVIAKMVVPPPLRAVFPDVAKKVEDFVRGLFG